MDRKLREKIRQATEGSDAGESGFIDLLRLIDQHYDRMEATITQSLTVTTTPIEVVFDSVTEALMSVNEHGEVRVCNKVCSRYFGLAKDQIIGSNLESSTTPSGGSPSSTRQTGLSASRYTTVSVAVSVICSKFAIG